MKETKAIILAAGKGSRMRSDLPKVLHAVNGRPMIEHSIEKARSVGIEDIIAVVGYKREQVREALGDSVRYVVQDQQLGTGHAVMMARDLLAGFDGNVVVLYGDMPLITAGTIHQLIETREQDEVKAALLTIVLDNPPDFGRIVRDEQGHIQRIVEVRDASPQELKIKEVNVGMYCFDCQELLAALEALDNDNAQNEYYLTDVVGIMCDEGLAVETVVTGNLEETLGINDPAHLQFAESLADIKYAESLYDLIDAVLAQQRNSSPG
jgi:bifunctional UDP-N-acetylglucosamine pyrophosphorylase/glucosamine-1-phosphate N-acetyltransferase